MCVRPSQGIPGTVSHRMVGPVRAQQLVAKWQTPVVKNWVAEGTDLSQSVEPSSRRVRYVLLGAVGLVVPKGDDSTTPPTPLSLRGPPKGLRPQGGAKGGREQTRSVLSTEQARQKHGDLSRRVMNKQQTPAAKAAGGPTKLGEARAKRGKMMPMSIATERNKGFLRAHRGLSRGPKQAQGTSGPTTAEVVETPWPKRGPIGPPSQLPPAAAPSSQGSVGGDGRGRMCVCKESGDGCPEANLARSKSPITEQSSSTDPKAQKEQRESHTPCGQTPRKVCRSAKWKRKTAQQHQTEPMPCAQPRCARALRGMGTPLPPPRRPAVPLGAVYASPESG